MKKVIIENIPKELIVFPQFVCWKAKPKDNGKTDKIPFSPVTGKHASVSDPATWGTIGQAVNAYQSGGYSGIGFVLISSDPFTGVDLDGCRNEAGEIEPWAQEIIQRVDSYTEVSPSMRGIRIFTIAELLEPGRRKGKVEVYTDGRFLTLTGHHLAGTPETIEVRHDEIKEFHRKYIAKPAGRHQARSGATTGGDMDDADLLRKARGAKNGAAFSRLFDGDWTGYPSQSEADFALCNLLAFWCDCDPDRMEQLFRQSGLYREKCDKAHYSGGETYLRHTISQAIRDTSKTYSSSRTGQREHAREKQNADHEETTLTSFNLTDLGNSERLIRRHGRDLLFCEAWKKWLIWDRYKWATDESLKVERMAEDTVRRIYEEASNCEDKEERKRIASWAHTSESNMRISAMIARARNKVPVLSRQLDADPWAKNVLNGTLNLQTGELRPHRREDLLTKLAPVEFDPDAEAPTWEKFLDRVMAGNREVIEFLKRLVGYSITGKTSEQKFPFLYGTGGNGKTVLMKIIQTMLGDYAKSVSSDALMVRPGGGGEGANPFLARLMGARFVVASETDEGKRLSESLVKQLTGEDVFAARHLYGDVFEFTPTFKLWLYGNHKPVIRGNDPGIWRRVLLVPFEVKIPEEERDKDLLDKLMAELPGIFAWAVRGCFDWQQIGLRPPKEVLQATNSYRSEMDTVEGFLGECCHIAPYASVQAGGIYEAYRKWCADNGEEAQVQRKFGMALTERGFIRERGTGGRYTWKGLGLVEVPKSGAKVG